jgi:hypothetical protein
MAAKIASVDFDGFIWETDVQRLWFFPDGSEYLQYAPHFHAIHFGGFRQNLPLTHMFVVVFEGKLSVKSYAGHTFKKIEVSDHMWYTAGTNCERRCRWAYAQMLSWDGGYVRSRR